MKSLNVGSPPPKLLFYNPKDNFSRCDGAVVVIKIGKQGNSNIFELHEMVLQIVEYGTSLNGSSALPLLFVPLE